MAQLQIKAPNGKTYQMPWSSDKDPTEEEIDAFILSQEGTDKKDSPPPPAVLPAVGTQPPAPPTNVRTTSAWDKLNQGLVPVEKMVAPVSESLFRYGESTGPKNLLERGYEGLTGRDPRAEGRYAGAYTQGLGQATEAMTSPVNVGLAATTGGASLAARYGMPSAAKNLTNLARGSSGAMGANAAYQGVTEGDPSQILPAVLGVAGTRMKVPQGKSAAAPLPVEPIAKPPMPPEFTAVGAEPPVVPPTFKDPSEAVFDKVLKQGGRPLDKTQLINTEVIKTAVENKPKIRRVSPTEVDMLNPTKENLEKAIGEGWTPSEINPDGSMRMVSADFKPSANVSPQFSGGRRPSAKRQELRQRPDSLKDVQIVTEQPKSSAAPAPTPKPKAEPLLPGELSKATPRYNIGSKVYIPKFASDVDKAAYIIAQKTKSRRNDDYLKFVMDATGLSADDAFNYGVRVKQSVKGQLKNAPEGTVAIPRIGHELPNGGLSGGSGVPPGSPPNTVPNSPASPSPKIPGKEGFFTKVGTGTKSLTTGLDLSGALRQGRVLMDRPEYYKALPSMFKAARSEAGYDAIQASIQQNRNYNLSQGLTDAGEAFGSKKKLAITDLKEGMDNREEAIMNNFTEKIPGIGRLYRGSNRAYTAFLNKLRMDTYSSLIDQARRQGKDITPKLNDDLIDFINNATGRGSLGDFESSAKFLNAALFSPRMATSRIALLRPDKYVNMDPFVRKQAIRSMASLAASQATFLGLGALAGAKVELNPTSADFGKLRVGNTRIDTNGGFQQYLRLAAQMGKGEVKSTTTGKIHKLDTGKFGSLTRAGTLRRFIETKEAPLTSFILNDVWGKDFKGDDITIAEATVKRMVPMFLQDLWELKEEDPEIIAAAGLTAFFGGSVQSYPDKKKNLFPVRKIGQ